MWWLMSYVFGCHFPVRGVSKKNSKWRSCIYSFNKYDKYNASPFFCVSRHPCRALLSTVPQPSPVRSDPQTYRGCAASCHLGYLHSPGEKDAQQCQPQQELLTTSHGLDFTPSGLGRIWLPTASLKTYAIWSGVLTFLVNECERDASTAQTNSLKFWVHFVAVFFQYSHYFK